MKKKKLKYKGLNVNNGIKKKDQWWFDIVFKKK